MTYSVRQHTQQDDFCEGFLAKSPMEPSWIRVGERPNLPRPGQLRDRPNLQACLSWHSKRNPSSWTGLARKTSLQVASLTPGRRHLRAACSHPVGLTSSPVFLLTVGCSLLSVLSTPKPTYAAPKRLKATLSSCGNSRSHHLKQ